MGVIPYSLSTILTMDNYQETFQTWDKLAPLYEELFMQLELYEDSYVAFCAAVDKEDAAILEVGCGPGNITQRLLHYQPQFQITATDISPNMVAYAQKNNPTAHCLVWDARALGKLEGQFDGIMVGFTIPYLSELDVADLLANSFNLLEERGILYLSFVPGKYEASGYITGSTGDRVYFYYHELDVLKKHLQENHFEVLTVLEKTYTRANGPTEQHCILIAQKQAS